MEQPVEQHCYRDCRLCGKKRKNALYKYSHKQHKFQFNLSCLKSHPQHLLCSKQSKQPPSPEKKNPEKTPQKAFQISLLCTGDVRTFKLNTYFYKYLLFQGISSFGIWYRKGSLSWWQHNLIEMFHYSFSIPHFRIYYGLSQILIKNYRIKVHEALRIFHRVSNAATQDSRLVQTHQNNSLLLLPLTTSKGFWEH